MEAAIKKAKVLIEALGWIRQFRDRYVVIKLGGSALENEEAVRSFLTDVIFMETVGMKPILVHGGGKAISQAMNDAGIEPNFVHGRRYTDEKTLDIATRVLAEEIAPALVQEIQRQGGKAARLTYLTTNLLIGEKLTLQDDKGEPIDLGCVGQVTDINLDLLEGTFRAGKIPVIPSVALDVNGQKLNVNADTAAAAVARLLKSEKLVFVSDVPGIFRDKDNPETLISHLDIEQCRAFIADGTIDAGMVPKVDAALDALQAGVGKVHIVDGRMLHSVLLEIYSNHGVGTEIVNEKEKTKN
ncbi:Acetylglutamate kinase [hydrothermal vent metagenome]|uniref:acetylglutamate kinase n=1 Tax=hydrothermal vent metagenome TaxID=652676 RepID=A0A3B1DCV3_9ZZZZ